SGHTRSLATPYPTLSLHDALPIFERAVLEHCTKRLPFGAEIALGRVDPHHRDRHVDERIDQLHQRHELIGVACGKAPDLGRGLRDRKSTRLNSSHVKISYAVVCLK